MTDEGPRVGFHELQIGRRAASEFSELRKTTGSLILAALPETSSNALIFFCGFQRLLCSASANRRAGLSLLASRVYLKFGKQ